MFRVEALHTTVNNFLEFGDGSKLDSAVILQLLVNVFEPQIDNLSILVANFTERFTSSSLVGGRKECKLMRESPLKILSNFLHAPRLVHLCDLIVSVAQRSITAGLNDPI